MNLDIIVCAGRYFPIEIDLDEQIFGFYPISNIKDKKAAIDKITQGILEFYNIPIEMDGKPSYHIVGCTLRPDKNEKVVIEYY